MFWSLFFGGVVLAAVILKYLKPWGMRCPQCGARREDAESPLCPECGWIFDLPGDEDEFYEEETGL